VRPTLAVASVLAIGAGIAMIIAGLRPAPTSAPTRHRPNPLTGITRLAREALGAHLPAGRRRTRRVLIAAAVVAGILAWLLSGWILPVVLLPTLAVLIPILLATPPSAANVPLLIALEQWIRAIATLLVASSGIEQAILASVPSASPAIQPQVRALAARLRAQMPTEPALRAFADDLNDSTGDLVAAALILGARRRDRGLADALTDFAASVAEEVRMRQAVEADRATPRNTLRGVTLVSVVILTAAFVFTDHMDPYKHGLGQVALLFLLTLFGAALAWMRYMATGKPTPRFLTNTREEATR
jgi:tight adherence protein B